MITLGLETTSSLGTVALVRDKALLGETELEQPLRHSRYVIPAINRLLVSHGLGVSDIDIIAVGTGPGSFTGIRVGIAISKGINCDQSIKMAGIPSLENIACQVDSDKLVASYIYAQRNEFFVQQFRRTDVGMEPISDCVIIHAGSMADQLQQPAILAGPDFAKLQMLESAGIDRIEKPVYPRAKIAAMLAADLSEDKLVASKILPLYVRRSEAEEKGAKVYKF